MTIKCDTVTQHWARILAQMGNKSELSQLDWGEHKMADTSKVGTHSHTHTIALPKDLTCGLQSTTQPVPTPPASGHQMVGTDRQWSKNEGKQGLPSLALVCWVVSWAHQPVYQGTHLPTGCSRFWQEQCVQFYPVGTSLVPRAAIT